MFIDKPESIPLRDFDGVCLMANFNKERFDVDNFELLNIPMPQHIVKSVKKRQAEYLAGRYLAKLAQERLNGIASEIATGPQREPLWPNGLIGSISHHQSQAVCALTKQSNPEQGIGIDIESVVDEETQAALIKTVVIEEERMLLKNYFTESEGLTAIFSAKESIFKACYPQVKGYFDFLDVQLISCSRESFHFIFNKKLSNFINEGNIIPVSIYPQNDTILTFTDSNWIKN
ncbi:phosphopantetheinyl transferase [Veronia nyctiphanis]|uniref:Enterobactin synthase component D n=1 Tax=Veronia nyctiphanis TaxID=1278244 RepID=A0A4Q0YL00_9GAMM|nr:4'-phosphopantetheinyl transferase superfamily protein [Veronia nyctiphanis]RXJ71045.1 phosphopantetheinyl transferase [Veronia nyctiphanis]